MTSGTGRAEYDVDPIRLASELQKAAPHDILQAWQDGVIGYREAMRLTGCGNLFELYQACRSSGVALRGDLTASEMAAVEAAIADITEAPRDA